MEAAAEHWVLHQERRGRIRGLSGSRQWFIQTALSWLRFLGRLEAHDKRPLPFAGLVEHEALALTLADVDVSNAMLFIHTSKFYKTRLVPLGPDLTRALKAYATRRAMQHPSGPEGPFFVSRTGAPLIRRAAEHTFSRLRLLAGVLRHDGARYQPRLHDLRHAFSVHRLVAWVSPRGRCTALTFI